MMRSNGNMYVSRVDMDKRRAKELKMDFTPSLNDKYYYFKRHMFLCIAKWALDKVSNREIIKVSDFACYGMSGTVNLSPAACRILAIKEDKERG